MTAAYLLAEPSNLPNLILVRQKPNALKKGLCYFDMTSVLQAKALPAALRQVPVPFLQPWRSIYSLCFSQALESA